MKSMPAAEAKNNFGALMNQVRHEPVTITKKGRPTVVVLSVEDYERRRAMAKRTLLANLNRAQIHANSRGLTETKIDQLLADES